VPEPWLITEGKSFAATLTLLAESDLLALVPHPFTSTPPDSFIDAMVTADGSTAMDSARSSWLRFRIG
jgi:hypothetical protein